MTTPPNGSNDPTIDELDEYLRQHPEVAEQASLLAIGHDSRAISRVHSSRNELVSSLVDIVSAVFAEHPQKQFPTVRSLLITVLRRDRGLWQFGIVSWVLRAMVGIMALVGGYETVSRFQEPSEVLPMVLHVVEPSKWGGKQLRLEGYETRSRSPFASRLVAFDANNNSQLPIWTANLSQDDFPIDLVARRENTYDSGQFAVRVLEAFDVFPDNPGDEIVTVFNHNNFSQCCIRILDTRGCVLYSVWHDGNVTSAYWVASKGVLVLAAVNGEVHAEDRGLPQYHRNHPIVLMGIAPDRRTLRTAWIETVDHHGGVVPVFYRYLDCGNTPTPVDAIVDFEVGPRRPGETPPEDFRLDLAFNTRWGKASYSFGADVAGRGVKDSQIIHDTYRRAIRSNELPDPSCFQLFDLPRILVEPDWLPGGSFENAGDLQEN